MAKCSLDYKTMMKELDQLLDDMQDDNLDIDEALSKYERGQQLVRELSHYLQSAETKITNHKLESA